MSFLDWLHSKGVARMDDLRSVGKRLDDTAECAQSAMTEYAARIGEWRKHDLNAVNGVERRMLDLLKEFETLRESYDRRLLGMADGIDSLRAMVMRYENRILQLEARLPVDDATDEWLDAEHACLHLGIGRSTLAKLHLPKRGGGRRHYWSRKVLDAWAESRMKR